jgi:hypothetical protein
MSDTGGMSPPNPKESQWYSTPAEARKRKPFTITMSEEAKERLDKMAKARGVSRSQVLEALVMASPIRG